MRMAIILSLLLTARTLTAQSVIVTAALETNRLAPGATTLLTVYAQVAPEFRATSDQIISWYVDLLALDDTIAVLDPAQLVRPLSDNDPLTSSSGTPAGPNLRAIHDTFLNTTNAGVQQPIELFSIPVRALAPGVAAFAVQAGTEDPNLAADFLVAPIGDGPLLTGGDYTSARVELRVIAPLTNLLASITQTALPENRGQLITIRFPVSPENSYTVEYRDKIAAAGALVWQPLPNAPHNLGYADDTNTVPARVYRVNVMQ